MAKDGVHGVPGLLSSDAEVLLESASHGRENGLSRFVGIHGDGGPGVLPGAQTADMRESFLSGDDEARFSLPDSALVFQFVVESLVVPTSLRSASDKGALSYRRWREISQETRTSMIGDGRDPYPFSKPEVSFKHPNSRYRKSAPHTYIYTHTYTRTRTNARAEKSELRRKENEALGRTHLLELMAVMAAVCADKSPLGSPSKLYTLNLAGLAWLEFLPLAAPAPPPRTPGRFSKKGLYVGNSL